MADAEATSRRLAKRITQEVVERTHEVRILDLPTGSARINERRAREKSASPMLACGGKARASDGRR